MSAQEPQTNNAILWHAEPEQTGAQPRPVLRGWLMEAGLLTARLRRLCENGFRLEVLETATDPVLPLNGNIHRRVILHCGDQPCIYAETIVPATTVNQHPWLGELGEEPLGERLQAHSGVRRSEFRFARLTPDSLPHHLAAAHTAPLWARQSEFHIGAASLTVTEVFLSGLVDDENRQLKLAE